MKPILVLGATGYVGGRLIPTLLERGFKVRASARSLEKLKSREWADHPLVELCAADVTNLEDLKRACENCSVIFYLVHTMISASHAFEHEDRQAALHLVKAAEEAGVERIIYLGGLGEDQPNLSLHLKSRVEVAQILKTGRVPVTVLRAAMIIGAGSASFEILRYLVDRLPIMITPKWVSTLNQPISIRNVVEYLVGCLLQTETTGKSFDIGGADVLTYRKLMEIYAEEAHLTKRWVITVPVLSPRLSSYWIHLVTPVPASIARPLAEGLKNPVVCRDQAIQKIIPLQLLSCREAIQVSLQHFKKNEIESHWTDAGTIPKQMSLPQEGDPHWAGGTVFRDIRKADVFASSKELWSVVASIGGKNGWYHADWLWKIRGILDRLLGGVGLRRGRKHPEVIEIGDALDFWRVFDCRKEVCLKLYAEMKLPGTAMLQFEIRPMDAGRSELKQSALFFPKGLLGILYWFLVLPFHGYIFQGMIEAVKSQAERKKELRRILS